MPYIITTTTRTRSNACTCVVGDAVEYHGHRDGCPVPTRRAVATLDEAREYADATVIRAFDTADQGDRNDAAWQDYEYLFRDVAQALPETGGTVGPLPDGTVIEVARVALGAINKATPESKRDNPTRCPWEERTSRIVAAHSAAQS